MLELMSFATNRSRRWLCLYGNVETSNVEINPWILVVQYTSNTLISIARYNALSFEKEQEFFAKVTAKELRKGA